MDRHHGLLEHRGDGPLPVDGYGLDLGGQTATLTTADGGLAPLEPGDQLAVYTGPGPADPATVGPRVLALGREAPALRDGGETVAVTTRTGEVSDHATFG